jgi:hypothetical protein
MFRSVKRMRDGRRRNRPVSCALGSQQVSQRSCELAMATNATNVPDHYPSPSRPVIIYVAVLIAALAIVAVGATIWLSTGDSGTNVLATDEKAITRTP